MKNCSKRKVVILLVFLFLLKFNISPVTARIDCDLNPDAPICNPIDPTDPPLDYTQPTVSISSPTSGQVFATNPIAVSGTAYDGGPIGVKGIETIEVKVSAAGIYQPATGTASWSAQVTLSEGQNIIYARATDLSGNIRETSVTVSYNHPDTTLPAISISSLPQTVSTSSITITGAASDDVGLSKVDVKVNAGIYQPATGTASWSAQVTLSEGQNTIYAEAWDTSGNIKEISATVTYSPSNDALPYLTTITVTPPTASVAVDETISFTAVTKDQLGNPMTAAVDWSSSDTNVGTIDASGLFKGVAAGTTTITATSGSVSGSANVAVTSSLPAPILTTLRVSPSTASVIVGDVQTFTASTVDQNNNPIASTVTWSSGNTTVGTISGTGSFKALTAGTTAITATATNGAVRLTESVTATVTESPQIKGKIFVTSDPPGARIYIDGNDTGYITPYTLIDVDPGEHKITVAKSNHTSSPSLRTLDVDSVNPENAEFILSPMDISRVGSISVISVPEGAEVSIDGEKKGNAYIVVPKVPEGEHGILCTKEGYEDFHQAIKVVAGDTAPLTCNLVALASASASPVPSQTKPKATNWPGALLTIVLITAVGRILKKKSLG